MNDTLILSLYP